MTHLQAGVDLHVARVAIGLAVTAAHREPDHGTDHGTRRTALSHYGICRGRRVLAAMQLMTLDTGQGH